MEADIILEVSILKVLLPFWSELFLIRIELNLKSNSLEGLLKISFNPSKSFKEPKMSEESLWLVEASVVFSSICSNSCFWQEIIRNREQANK